MFDVIAIGSSLVDVFVHCDQFQLTPSEKGLMLCQLYGDKVEVDGFELHTGGGGGNTAVGFARLGFKTAVVSELGKDVLADLIVEDFHREFVMTNFLVKERKEQTGGAVMLVGPTGDRTVMVHRGAASMLDPHDLPESQLRQADWVHLSSISGRLNTLQHLFQVMRGKEKRISWNPGKRELNLLAQRQLKAAELPVEILILNRSEWAIVESVQNELIEQIPEIVITDGPNGGWIKSADGRRRPFAPSGEQAVEATGAGDAFAVGYVAGRRWNKSPDEAAKLGASNAGSVVTKVGAKAGLISKEQLV